MHAPLSTNRQRYYQLLGLVCEDLPYSAIDTLVRNGHAASSVQITAVRQGRRIDLPVLIELIRVGLPQFQIPAELLPIGMPQPLFQ